MDITMEETCSVVPMCVDTVIHDLLKMINSCGKRCLRKTCMWASELYYALKQENKDFYINPKRIQENDGFSPKEVSSYFLAKSYFDGQEYDRAASFLQHCTSPVPRFLYLYSLYCSGEKKLLNNMTDHTLYLCPKPQAPNIQSLARELQIARSEDKLDGYGMYLLGIVFKKIHVPKQATPVLCDAINIEPLNWGAWLELSTLVTDNEMLDNLPLPDHWMKNFFMAHVYLELQKNENALELYKKIESFGFSHSTYVMAQKAIGYHNIRNLEMAISGFHDVLKADPYRLDNLDIYSNLLYVKEARGALSKLASKACKVDKYRVETCCVIGNFYSLRTQHEKAILSFQRAVQINPNYSSAWTLMGHEYMEMKNVAVAVQAYRQAIETDRRDYRAWYGLGQTYEMLKMPYFCLYYYMQAHRLRPGDTRMMIALGESYEKLDKFEEAKKCYYWAHNSGDYDTVGLLHLAKLYERLGEYDQAAAAYLEYEKEMKSKNRKDMWLAYLFLAKYYYRHLNLDKTSHYAELCLEFSETKEDGKVLIRQVNSRRAMDDKNITRVQSSNPDSLDDDDDDNNGEAQIDVLTLS